MRTVPTIVWLWLALPVFAPAGASQAVSPGDVGVQERLGQKVPLDVPFLDEHGREITLRQLADRPVVLTLNYFRCSGICTPLLNGLVDALNELKLDPDRTFRVVTVSFDERDTPQIARKKRDNLIKQLKRPFSPSTWRLLVGRTDATGGRPSSVEALTRAVGFQYRSQGKEFVHPGVVVVLSPTGVVTRYMYGVNFPAADLEMAIREATRGQARPTVIKALQFCTVYDPESRQQVFRLTRLVGAVTLVGLALFVVILIRAGRPVAKGPE
ncbi:MAG: SCO family protein [Candidatus Riflebacteria bacterium]|nr:SCO family protein [Candidatus Riflebacteria bacterium]